MTLVEASFCAPGTRSRAIDRARGGAPWNRHSARWFWFMTNTPGLWRNSVPVVGDDSVAQVSQHPVVVRQLQLARRTHAEQGTVSGVANSAGARPR